MNDRSREVMHSSASPEHYTPPEVLDAIRAFAPIAFDPFANPRALVRAERSIVLPENGLIVGWPRRGLIFSNPPYGDALLDCARKTAAEAALGSEIITLVPARIGAAWWRALAAPLYCGWAGRIAFFEPEEQWRARVALRKGLTAEQAGLLKPRRRLGDLVANESAPFDAALCYHGPRPQAFAAHFGAYGAIYYASPARPARSGGRPRAPLPPLNAVQAMLGQGFGIREMARVLELPKCRIEEARRQLLGLPERVRKPVGLRTGADAPPLGEVRP